MILEKSEEEDEETDSDDECVRIREESFVSTGVEENLSNNKDDKNDSSSLKENLVLTENLREMSIKDNKNENDKIDSDDDSFYENSDTDSDDESESYVTSISKKIDLEKKEENGNIANEDFFAEYAVSSNSYF